MRKSSIRTLIAALLIASCMTATAYAETALVTGSEVFVRSGPGVDYAILGSYSRNASVDVLDRSDPDWYKVNYNGTVGYMTSGFLALQPESYTITTDSGSTVGQSIILSDSSVYTPPAVVITPSAPAAQSGSSDGQINGMHVRFRSGPSADTAILGEYDQGKAVTVVSVEGDWTLCLIDGTYGYIYSPFVTRTGAPAPAVTPAPSASSVTDGPGIVIQQGTVYVPAATPAPTANDGQSIIIDYPAAAAVTPAPVPTATPAPVSGSGAPGVITGDYVRFRRGPGTDHSIIASYDRGQDVTIFGTEGDWVYCSINGQSGYVYGRYVQASPKTPVGSAVGQPAAVGTAVIQQPAASGTAVIQQPAANGTAVIQQPAAAPVPNADPLVTGTGTPGYIKGNNVRFRSGPDLDSAILGELFYGNTVEILGTDGTWTAIVYKGQAGYVFSQYVTSGSIQNVSTGGTATGRGIADYALQYVGTPYCWGGADPSTGFDCSGFVYYVYRHFGYSLNRVASEQALNGKHVEATDLQPGDLLCFYSGGNYIGHVGLYIGNNMFVHAATSSTGVITSELTGYYAKRGFEARRIVG